jgi:hypothetical protein
MNKSLVVITLFLGFLVAANKSEASVGTINIFKSMEKMQSNPWDPRTGEEASRSQDDSGREVIPEPEHSEGETEE